MTHDDVLMRTNTLGTCSTKITSMECVEGDIMEQIEIFGITLSGWMLKDYQILFYIVRL